MHRDQRDPGTLAYIIVNKRVGEGLPLLAKALPSVSEMDAWSEQRGLHLDSDVALYLDDSSALTAWESLAEDVKGRTEVRAIIVYYTATVAHGGKDISLAERYQLIKKEVSRMVYTRNKLSTATEAQEKELREIEQQIPHAEADTNAETVLTVLRDKKEKGETRLLELRRDFEEAYRLSERAKAALLLVQNMMAEDLKSAESLKLRASAREAMRLLEELLGPLP
jgi:hypothetical protein